jgi:hypothetical protein
MLFANAVVTNEASRWRVGIAELGEVIRPVSVPFVLRNPRNRANRRCRWRADHVCRARSLVRLVLVASIVVPPRPLRDPAAWRKLS